MTFCYLIRNREKPKFFSTRWLIVWIKRVLTAHVLIKILWSKWYCKIRGGKVGVLSILEGTNFNGKISNFEIGNNSFVDGSAYFALHNKVIIGSNVVINSGAHFLTASHYLNDSSWGQYSEPIHVHDFAWVATNAVILPGVTIGRGAVVGAGAVVREDVSPYMVVIGNPAVTVSKRLCDLDYSPVFLCSPYEAWLGKR